MALSPNCPWTGEVCQSRVFLLTAEGMLEKSGALIDQLSAKVDSEFLPSLDAARTKIAEHGGKVTQALERAGEATLGTCDKDDKLCGTLAALVANEVLNIDVPVGEDLVEVRIGVNYDTLRNNDGEI